MFGSIKQATTTRPKLACSRQLYQISTQLLHVKDREQAASWVDTYLEWCRRRKAFLAQKTPKDDGEGVHARTARAGTQQREPAAQPRGCCSPTPAPSSMGRCRRGTTRSKAPPTAPTPHAARSPQNASDAADQSNLLMVLHAHRKPASTSTTPQDHAHRRPHRSRMGTRLTSSPRRWRHPPVKRSGFCSVVVVRGFRVPGNYPSEFQGRAVRLVEDRLRVDPGASETSVIADAAMKLGTSRESLRWSSPEWILERARECQRRRVKRFAGCARRTRSCGARMRS